MSGARGENQDICGHIVSGTSTYPTPLSPSNHCVLEYSIVRKSPKRVAPYYEAPIRHESCQTTVCEPNHGQHGSVCGSGPDVAPPKNAVPILAKVNRSALKSLL